MADKEGTRRTAEAYVVSTTPDVCLTPMGGEDVPVGYSIVGWFNNATKTVTNVLFKKQEAFHLASRIDCVEGDEAGTSGGVKSGVNAGYCRPIEGSSTVKAKGEPVIRHGDPMEMNCAGPDGSANTVGKVNYVKVVQMASAKADGTVEVEDEDPLKKKWCHPLGETDSKVNSPYGSRKHPITGIQKPHDGIDLPAPSGTPVYSGLGGTVDRVKVSSTGSGNMVVIDHGNDVYSYYMHLKGFAEGLTAGDTVGWGQLIGYVGKTGGATGSHLHFGASKGAKYDKYVDPAKLNMTDKKKADSAKADGFKVTKN